MFNISKLYLRLLTILISVAVAPGVIAQPGAADEEMRDAPEINEALDHYLSGSVHEEAGDLHQAALEYHTALLLDEESSAIRIALSNLYMRLGQRDISTLILEKGRQLGSTDAELLRLLAGLYLRSGRQNEAAECYLDLAKVRDLYKMELLRLAAILSSLTRHDEALNAYKEFIGRFGQDIDVYHKIGLIHLLKRDIAAAETTFKTLIELDPSEHRVYFVLGGFAVSRKDWMNAEIYFRKAIEHDSTNIRYWTNLLMTLNERDKIEDVSQVVEMALDRFKNVPQLYEIKSGSLERIGELKEALAVIEESIRLDETRVSPYITKGYLHHLLKQWYLAAETYEDALKLAPDNPVVLNNYAYMLSEQDHRLEDAFRMVEKALEFSPDSPSFLDTRAWILYRLGKPKDALEQLKKALKQGEDNAELHEHLGYIYRALGKESKARKAWRKALKLDPHNEEYVRLVD